MPLPKPKKRESRIEFLRRCVSEYTMIEEFPDTEQRFAICVNIWKERNKESDKEKQRIDNNI